jgi:hypothetical protein
MLIVIVLTDAAEPDRVPATVANQQHLGTSTIPDRGPERTGIRDLNDLNQTVTMNRANIAQWE